MALGADDVHKIAHLARLAIDENQIEHYAKNLSDILTLVISENTDVVNQDQRAMDKSSDGGFNFNFAGASSAGGASSANVNLAGDI